jgi:hypothetical protein
MQFNFQSVVRNCSDKAGPKSFHLHAMWYLLHEMSEIGPRKCRRFQLCAK